MASDFSTADTLLSRPHHPDYWADVVLDDEKVSAFHAKFTVRDNQFLLWDLGSANGTFVNDMAIVAATLLKENDEIRMGNTIFVLKMLEAG